MKVLQPLFALCIMLVIYISCNKTSKDTVNLIGIVNAQGITTYQYGTHALEGHTRYALKSTAVNLDSYIGQNVIITGTAIAGYPIDGGPEYILVTAVEAQTP